MSARAAFVNATTRRTSSIGTRRLWCTSDTCAIRNPSNPSGKSLTLMTVSVTSYAHTSTRLPYTGGTLTPTAAAATAHLKNSLRVTTPKLSPRLPTPPRTNPPGQSPPPASAHTTPTCKPSAPPPQPLPYSPRPAPPPPTHNSHPHETNDTALAPPPPTHP